MAGWNNDPFGEPRRPSRSRINSSLAATRNASLSRVDLVLSSSSAAAAVIGPPSGFPTTCIEGDAGSQQLPFCSTSRGRDDQARRGLATEVIHSPMAAGRSGEGCGSGRGFGVSAARVSLGVSAGTPAGPLAAAAATAAAAVPDGPTVDRGGGGGSGGRGGGGAVSSGSRPVSEDRPSSAVLMSGSLNSHQPLPASTPTTTASTPPAGGDGTSSSHRARTSTDVYSRARAEGARMSRNISSRSDVALPHTDVYSRARAEGARMSRSMSSRSQRAASMPSIRPLIPAARGMGLESATSRTLSARNLSAVSRRAVSSSLSTPLGAASADTRPGGGFPRTLPSSQQEHPRTSCPLSNSSRQAGGGGRSGGGRASMHRLAGGGRDSWRASAVAPTTAAERRPARDRTALREVSARLDAAATAIDAVEIGVRSAADSLDSLLQLLESRQGSAVSAPATTTTTSGSRGRGSSTAEASASPATVAVIPSSAVNGSVTGAIPGAVSGGFAGSPPVAAADGEVSPVFSAHGSGREGGGGLRAANMLRRELLVGLTPRASQRAAEERANTNERGCRTASFATRYGADGTPEDPVAVRDASVEEVKEERSSPSRAAENSPVILSTPQLATGRDAAEETASCVSVEEQANRERHDVGRPANSATLGGRAESAPAVRCRRADNGSVAIEPAVTDPAAVSRPIDDNTQSHSSQAPETRPSPRVREVGSNSLPGDGVDVATNPENRLEQQVVELAMENIDAERGRLILEIARLRGQQHQSLAHLHRLQHEQFVVRQRQVSTLSDIVNSFGRTVEAASTLPHGDNSSLGRISSDVVSTLRRMLRLLSATVPVAAPGGRSSSPTNLAGMPLSTAATATRPDDALLSSTRARHPAREGSSAADGSRGTDSVGGRVALRPSGADLTQEVIDAALQALPRLAAAATAISGARRMQGYAAGLAGGSPGAAEERRCCSSETIAALPDAPPYADGVVEGVGSGGGGGDDGHRGCVICLSEGSVATQLLCRLPCNHVFHRVCVGKWLRMHDSCPTCRRQVPNVEVGAAAATTTPV